ncbi:MAG: DUF2254 domain-containing protein [Spirochaetaceae bacterium]
MRARLGKIRSSLRHSFWFIPTLMTVGGALLSLLVGELGDYFDLPMFRRAVPLGAQGLRDLLGMVASSMITVATTAFSIIIVALQLASGQLGPRLLRKFIRDRGNQFVFGTFLGTFVYVLLLLRRVGDGPLPSGISVLIALLLTVVSVGVLIFFIHHSAVSIQKDRVIARVSEELMSSVGKLYPKTIGIDRSEAIRNNEGREEWGRNNSEGDLPDRSEGAWDDARELRLPASGYVQAVDSNKLMRLCSRHDLQVFMKKRPGDFVPQRVVVAMVRPVEHVTDSVLRQLSDVFVLGIERTVQQDVAFVFDQLLEIAIRALSPAVTDTFTAMRCIDRLTDALALVTRTSFPSPYRYDKSGVLRVITHPIDFDVLVSMVLYPLAEESAGHTNVISRLFRGVSEIGESAEDDREREALLRFNDYLLALARTAPGQPDRYSKIEELHRSAEKTIRG